MNWQLHTVRRFMAGAMKKAGYTREMPPGHGTGPNSATVRVGPPPAPISASFHFYTGHLIRQTIAFRGLLPRAFGPRNLMKIPWHAVTGFGIRHSTKIRPRA